MSLTVVKRILFKNNSLQINFVQAFKIFFQIKWSKNLERILNKSIFTIFVVFLFQVLNNIKKAIYRFSWLKKYRCIWKMWFDKKKKRRRKAYWCVFRSEHALSKGENSSKNMKLQFWWLLLILKFDHREYKQKGPFFLIKQITSWLKITWDSHLFKIKRPCGCWRQQYSRQWRKTKLKSKSQQKWS